ncbi:uncharacterized protein LOC111894281 isoform X1 [Lactuca sativa]|uniref:uncharacterized protein LOC111894281 isoform X1 n=1 Tax=Lactuca sativa TaxID=4236 RepID=UPI001C692575|nr:uncharacterized protein LOC111894281 isoform X1 [Lactuca sativa]XP_042755899.1 uncharacterized protein LOC111894281 isoform X1 [Lactuca sativa]
MASKRPRSTESDEQVVQQCAPMIRRAESSSVKFNNYNHNPLVVVFAHGAGAPSTSEWMTRWRTLLANALNPVEVVTFDYPYISGRRKAAPDAEKLVGFHLEFVRKVAAKYPEHPLILIGKSLGSRVSCMVAAENDIGALAVVCLGYPLKAKNGAIRDETLMKLTTPIMFVQGSNDNFCPLKLLEVVRQKLKSLNDLHVIEHGDHSFQIAKKNLELTGMTHEEAEQRAAESIAMFVSRIKNENNTCELEVDAIQFGQESKSVEEEECQNVETSIIMNRAEFRKKSEMILKKRHKSERILRLKLSKRIYDKNGRGSTIEYHLFVSYGYTL